VNASVTPGERAKDGRGGGRARLAPRAAVAAKSCARVRAILALPRACSRAATALQVSLLYETKGIADGWLDGRRRRWGEAAASFAWRFRAVGARGRRLDREHGKAYWSGPGGGCADGPVGARGIEEGTAMIVAALRRMLSA
jgi:hypothetical protein